MINRYTDMMMERDSLSNDYWEEDSLSRNISAMSWRPVLVVEETGVPGENHRPWTSYW
jgi:hypothetical protein